MFGCKRAFAPIATQAPRNTIVGVSPLWDTTVWNLTPYGTTVRIWPTCVMVFGS
jgi:hypothetical protein